MEQKVISLYNAGKTNKEIASVFNVHRTTIQRILKKNGIKLRTQEETSRKYKILDNFETISNQDQAYILGFLYADGNISRNYIDISLHEKDGNILKKISKHFYGKIILHERKEKMFTRNGKIYKSSRQIRFNLGSKEVVKNVKKFGLVENKTFKIRFPKLRRDLISHFIRGYFDGDGCLHIAKIKGNNRISIVSNPNFCNDLKNVISKICGLEVLVKRKTDKVDDVLIFGNIKIKKFLDWMYKDADLKLQRKYKLYTDNFK